MIEQTEVVHDYISLSSNAKYSNDEIDPLEYKWFAVRESTELDVPHDGVILTCCNSTWLGIIEDRLNEIEEYEKAKSNHSGIS